MNMGKVKVSHPVMSDSLQSYGLLPAQLRCPRAEAPMIALRSTLKQPKQMPRGTQVKRDRLAISVERGEHVKQDYSQAFNPPPAPCAVCKGPHWRRECPQSPRPQGPDSPDNHD